MQFNSFERRMFNQARIEAEKSGFDRFHVGCVISYKNKIIGRGSNGDKTHPMQQKYNRRYRKFNVNKGGFVKHSVHAEISALSSVPYVIGKDVDWGKVKIFVYRICHGKPNGYGLAKPCPACLNAIRDIGIRHVYFTSDEGYSYLELDA